MALLSETRQSIPCAPSWSGSSADLHVSTGNTFSDLDRHGIYLCTSFTVPLFLADGVQRIRPELRQEELVA